MKENRELKNNREAGIPSCVYFLPLQYLNSLRSMLEEKSVSCPAGSLYSSDECKSLMLNVLYVCFQKHSSIPTQTDLFSRSSKLHDCNIVLHITGPVQYKKIGLYSNKNAFNNKFPSKMIINSLCCI